MQNFNKLNLNYFMKLKHENNEIHNLNNHFEYGRLESIGSTR